MKRETTLLLFTLFLTACATFPEAQTPRGQRNLLTPLQFMETDCISAFDAIQRLRPQWLRARGPVGFSSSSPDYPLVVVDDIRMIDPNELRRIPLTLIQEMRFLDSGQATVRYGLGFTSGAIVIRTGRRGP